MLMRTTSEGIHSSINLGYFELNDIPYIIMFKQSLPGIKAISYVPCCLLSPNILEKYHAGVPIGIFAYSKSIEHYGNASCEAESKYIGGGYFEKTSLDFTTTDEIPQSQELAFVVTDVHDKSYLIGVMEAPFPIVNITTKVDDETNISEVEVTFQRQKSLIPCVV